MHANNGRQADRVLDDLVWDLQHQMVKPTEKDIVDADMAGVSVEQYMFNQWVDCIDRAGDSFEMLDENSRVKLAWWKCAFWAVVPNCMLGTDGNMFKGWKIGHCLNCDADPYDGVVYAWFHGHFWHRGALIRCNRCGQFRWQEGECGDDYL